MTQLAFTFILLSLITSIVERLYLTDSARRILRSKPNPNRSQDEVRSFIRASYFINRISLLLLSLSLALFVIGTN